MAGGGGAGPSWLRRAYRSAPLAAWAGAAAGAAGVAVGIVTLVVTSPWSGPAPAPATSTAAVAGAPPAGTTTSTRTSARTPPTGSGGPTCGDATGATPLDCTVPGAWYPVDTPACTVDSLLAGAGVDPELAALLIELRPAGGRCWAAPSAPARSAGAVTLDVARLSGTSLPAVLRSCARGPRGEPTVSCLSPHELEWIGPWRPVGTSDPVAGCLALARRYTGNALAEVAGRIEARVVQGAGQDGGRRYRCAVTVAGTTLDDTLYRIGEGALPTGS